MSSTKTENPEQKAGPATDHKFSVVVVTTGPASDPVSAPANQPLKPVVEKAFKQLGITTPLDQFTYKTQAGAEVNLQTKVDDACKTHDCRIFALPKKAQDA